MMNRDGIQKSQLDLSEHVCSQNATARTIEDNVVELASAVGISTFELTFRDVGRLAESNERSKVLNLITQAQFINCEHENFFKPAICNCLGLLSAIIGEPSRAAEHFQLALVLVTDDDDKKILLQNLLIVQLAQRKFGGAIETVQALAKLNDLAEINRLDSCAAILTIESGSLTGTQIDLDGTPTVIGRTALAKSEDSLDRFLELESRMVSRRHARLACENDQWSIEDLKSTAGTYVNGRRIHGVEHVKSGDRFRLGDIELSFSIPTDDSAEYAICGDEEYATKEDIFVSETGTVKCEVGDPLGRPVTLPQPVSEPEEQAPPYRHENVQFTVYRPRSVVPSKWYPLLAFAHLSDNPPDAEDTTSPIEQVQKQAAALLGTQAGAFQNTTQDALYAVPHEGELTLVPQMEGVQFNPLSRTFLWQETVHREEFRMMASAELIGKTARGRLTVFLGNIILADVPLVVSVTLTESTVSRQPLEPQSAAPYRKIFASYSHQDLQIVEQFERYVGVLGDEYVRDWRHLRSGQVWNDQLMKMIREADVFQLFWSSNSMRSPYVRQEWEYALSLGRPLFVRPTYWEKPLPSLPEEGLPPETLSRLHFQLLGNASKPAVPPIDSSSSKSVDSPICAPPPPCIPEAPCLPEAPHSPVASRSPEGRGQWHDPVRAMRLSLMERVLRWCRRRPAFSLMLIALTVIVIILVIALINWF